MLKQVTMKKLIIILIWNLPVLLSYGQANPIKNLMFSQSYVTPYNCYDLSWSPPDSSLTDTLVGYNIYRNNTLYRFTTDLYQRCDLCIGDTATTYCSNFYNLKYGHFKMHVNAVYNMSHIESTYNDTAEFMGLATRVNEIKNNFSFSISPNPFSTFTTLISGFSFKDATLTIYNSFGTPVRQVKNISGQTITLQRENLSSGLYFLRLTQENKTLRTDKLVVIDN